MVVLHLLQVRQRSPIPAVRGQITRKRETKVRGKMPAGVANEPYLSRERVPNKHERDIASIHNKPYVT